jgi:hypothetical protein
VIESGWNNVLNLTLDLSACLICRLIGSTSSWSHGIIESVTTLMSFQVFSCFGENGLRTVQRCFNVAISEMVDDRGFPHKSRDELQNIFDHFHYCHLELCKAVSQRIWICCFRAKIIMQTRNDTFWQCRYFYEMRSCHLLPDILFSLWIAWTVANFANCVNWKEIKRMKR